MAQSSHSARNRPLSPHLQIWRWHVTMAASILNRITGVGLALGALAAGWRAQFVLPVIAVTGSNGKTTVTSLTGQLVAHAGKSVAVAGNIGPTLLDTLWGHLEADTLPEVWVLELSSFQLDGVEGFEPAAATVLNLPEGAPAELERVLVESDVVSLHCPLTPETQAFDLRRHRPRDDVRSSHRRRCRPRDVVFFQ